MNLDTLERLVIDVLNTGVESLHDLGSITPVCFAFRASGEYDILVGDDKSVMQKELASGKYETWIILNEAWMVSLENGQGANYTLVEALARSVGVRNLPSRVEVVTVFGRSLEGCMYLTQEFTHTSNGIAMGKITVCSERYDPSHLITSWMTARQFQ